MSDSVRVDAQRSPNREHINGLHGLDGKTFTVDQCLDLLPSCSSLRTNNLSIAIEVDLVETPHVQHYAVFRESLATHAVPLAGN